MASIADVAKQHMEYTCYRCAYRTGQMDAAEAAKAIEKHMDRHHPGWRAEAVQAFTENREVTSDVGQPAHSPLPPGYQTTEPKQAWWIRVDVPVDVPRLRDDEETYPKFRAVAGSQRLSHAEALHTVEAELLREWPGSRVTLLQEREVYEPSTHTRRIENPRTPR